MPLTPEELQELKDLEELESLEAEERSEPATGQKAAGFAKGISSLLLPAGLGASILSVPEHKQLVRGLATSATLGYLPKAAEALGGSAKEALGYDAAEQAARETPGLAGAGEAAAALLPIPGMGATKAASTLGRIGSQAAKGAVLGAVYDPGKQEEGEGAFQLEKRGLGALLGGGLGGGAQAAAELAPKAANALMRSAVGGKNLPPGTEQELLKEGVWGTRKGMTRQVASKQITTNRRIEDLVRQIPDSIEASKVAERIGEQVAPLLDESGQLINAADRVKFNRIIKSVEDVLKKGDISPETALQSRRQAGKLAREAGAYKLHPSSTMKSGVHKAEQEAYSKALKEAYASAFPENSGQLAEADRLYSALASTGKALEAKPSVTQNIAGAAKKALAGAAGFGVAGPAGALVAPALTTPLSKSIAAQLTFKGGKALSSDQQQALIRAILETKRKE